MSALENSSEITTNKNVAAWMLSCKSSFQYLTPILQEFNWLPVIFLTYFKALVITYKNLCPGYLKDCLILQNSAWQSRSSRVGLLWVLLMLEASLVSTMVVPQLWCPSCEAPSLGRPAWPLLWYISYWVFQTELLKLAFLLLLNDFMTPSFCF